LNEPSNKSSSGSSGSSKSAQEPVRRSNRERHKPSYLKDYVQ
jgi:hypothetical protein